MATKKKQDDAQQCSSSTVTLLKTESTLQTPPLVLKLRSPKNSRRVKWDEGTVDNEGMGKKSSKCCCVYEKPKVFGESSSEEDSDGEDKKCKAPKAYHNALKKNEKHSHDTCSHCE